MKLEIRIGQEQFFRQIIKQGMQPKGFLKKAPIDERKLFLRAAEIDLAYQSTLRGGQKGVLHLVKVSKSKGIPLGVIKNRLGLKDNPLIKNFLKDTKKLKEALINYLEAK